MKEFKGTKGEWYNEDGMICTKDNIDGNVVCERPDIHACRDSNQYWEANAKLISAAPELLEACLEVIKIWNEDGEGGEIQLKTPIAWYRALRKSEKAINKALGE